MFRRKLAMPALAVMAVVISYEILSHRVAFAVAISFVFLGVLAICFWCKGNLRSAWIPSSGSWTWCIFMSVVLPWISLVHICYIDSLDPILPEMEGEILKVEGVIEEIRIEDAGERMSVVIRVDRAGKIDLHRQEKMLCDCPYYEGAAIGDRVCGEGKLRIPEPKRNPNTFNYRRYLRTEGIYSTMYAEEAITVPVRSDSLLSRLYRAKENYLEDLRSRGDDDAAHMMRAILFGDKGLLEEDLEETFRMNGTAHVLAVSGLHVGMIYGLILFIWNRLGGLLFGPGGNRRGWPFLLCVGTLLTVYAFLAGFAPSVVRAVIMILLHVFAGMTGRYYDLKSVTLAVFIVSVLVDPLILFQGGFQMSFLAILSLSIVMPYLSKFMSGTLLAGACIQIGLMPYMIYQFNWLSLPAVLINVPVIFLAGLIVPFGILSFTVFGLSGILCHIAGSMVGEHAGDLWPGAGSGLLVQVMEWFIALLCDLMVKLNDVCCLEGITAIRVCSPPAWAVFLFYMALVAFASESGRLMIKRAGKKPLCLSAVSVLLVSVIIGTAVDDGYRKMNMVFVDVGQGDCIHLRIKEKDGIPGIVTFGMGTGNYLIDGGGDEDYEVGTKTLRPYLLKNGVRTVDGAFISHLHTDHYRGICELAQAGMVKKLYVYEANKLKLDRICSETGMDEEDVIFLKKGDRIVLGKTLNGRITAYIDVLWPEKKKESEYRVMLDNEKDENASSLILRAVVEGVSLLATGDMGEEGEIDLMDSCGRVPTDADATANTTAAGVLSYSGSLGSDILKVGHHGSRYSTCEEFLDAVSPGLAVIQVSKGNTYGHPTPDVLERLSSRGIPIYRNDLQGAIGFLFRSGNTKEVRTMIE